MTLELKPIGHVSTQAQEIPRTWKISQVEGTLVIDEQYLEGLSDLKAGDRIYVLFHFHRSPAFSKEYLRVRPPHLEGKKGVFSTHSPIRPNPIGLSVLEVLGVEANRIRVRGLDMLDGTPILDMKPVSCPEDKN